MAENPQGDFESAPAQQDRQRNAGVDQMNRNQAIVELVKSLPIERRFWPAIIGIVMLGLGISALLITCVATARAWFQPS